MWSTIAIAPASSEKNDGLSSALFDVRVSRGLAAPASGPFAQRLVGRRGWHYFADAYGVVQESSAPRADEHAIWDTLRSRKPGSLRAMPNQFETSCAI